MVGCDVLRLLALVAEATRQPATSAQDLNDRATRLVNRARLAAMVAKSCLLDFVQEPDIGNVEELAANVGEALLGSVLVEPGSTFANVVSFWTWLATDDGITVPQELNHLSLALRHLGGQHRYYLGRTTTYEELLEIPKDNGSLALQVTYELDTKEVVKLRYEMVNARAQEVQVGVDGPGASMGRV